VNCSVAGSSSGLPPERAGLAYLADSLPREHALAGADERRFQEMHIHVVDAGLCAVDHKVVPRGGTWFTRTLWRRSAARIRQAYNVSETGTAFTAGAWGLIRARWLQTLRLIDGGQRP
jgi:hypothetical protein